MTHVAEALILRTYAYGESDRILVFLTRDRGKRRGVAKNARQSRRRFGGALEPMTTGRVSYVEREGRDLVFVNYVEPARSPLSVLDPDALCYVGYFAELIDEWAQDADPNEALFRLGSSMIDAMAAGVPVDALARYFEYWVLRLQGVYQTDPRLSPGAQAFLAAARAATPMSIGDVPVAPAVLTEIESAHRTLMTMHLEKDLKSARVLKEIASLSSPKRRKC